MSDLDTTQKKVISLEQLQRLGQEETFLENPTVIKAKRFLLENASDVLQLEWPTKPWYWKDGGAYWQARQIVDGLEPDSNNFAIASVRGYFGKLVDGDGQESTRRELLKTMGRIFDIDLTPNRAAVSADHLEFDDGSLVYSRLFDGIASMMTQLSATKPDRSTCQDYQETRQRAARFISGTKQYMNTLEDRAKYRKLNLLYSARRKRKASFGRERSASDAVGEVQEGNRRSKGPRSTDSEEALTIDGVGPRFEKNTSAVETLPENNSYVSGSDQLSAVGPQAVDSASKSQKIKFVIIAQEDEFRNLPVIKAIGINTWMVRNAQSKTIHQEDRSLAKHFHTWLKQTSIPDRYNTAFERLTTYFEEIAEMQEDRFAKNSPASPDALLVKNVLKLFPDHNIVKQQFMLNEESASNLHDALSGMSSQDPHTICCDDWRSKVFAARLLAKDAERLRDREQLQEKKAASRRFKAEHKLDGSHVTAPTSHAPFPSASSFADSVSDLHVNSATGFSGIYSSPTMGDNQTLGWQSR